MEYLERDELFLAPKMQLLKHAKKFLGQIKFRIKSNKNQIMILTFFLRYFNCFGEVILSPLIYYFKIKYFLERKKLKSKSSSALFDKISNMKIGKSPTLSEGP